MRIGRYELLEVVGRGGMGVVYRARQTDTDQIVAVKVLADEPLADPVLVKRFENEYAAVCRLQHPHIVRGLDYVAENNRLYLVMEFVVGRSLGQCVREQGPFPESEAVRLILHIAGALEAAHARKLIHRDVKPENILLTQDGQAKLVDLGLIKDLDSESVLTRPRAGLGTLTFMAPEQFDQADRADERCDIYGLAGTLYYILTGIVPFPGRGDLSIVRKKQQNDLVPPGQLLAALQPELSELICRALDASPTRRPASCAEFAAQLRTALTASAVPVSEPARAVESAGDERRRARRYPSALVVSCRATPESEQPLEAEIQDISVSGICLQLAGPVKRGALLQVEILDLKLNSSWVWLLRVCWVVGAAPGVWRAGCSFERNLSEEELNVLLGGIPATEVIRRRSD